MEIKKGKLRSKARTNHLRSLRSTAGVSSPISSKAANVLKMDTAHLSSTKPGVAAKPSIISNVINAAKVILPKTLSGKGLLLGLGAAALCLIAGPIAPLAIGGAFLASRMGILSKLAPLALTFLPMGGGLKGILGSALIPKITKMFFK